MAKKQRKTKVWSVQKTSPRSESVRMQAPKTSYWPAELQDASYSQDSSARGYHAKKLSDDWQYYLLIGSMLLLLWVLSRYALMSRSGERFAPAEENLAFAQNKNSLEAAEASHATAVYDRNIENLTESSAPALMWVYISGQVQKPGVYQVAPGSIVNDLVLLAGGLTPEAETAQVNLAALLSPHSQIHIGAEGEAPGADYLQDKSQFVSVESGGAVSLNYASKEELMTIPGIGPATAEAIIRYRESLTGEMSLEDLLQVPGIKEKRFEQIRPNLTLP
ncbi:MAG: ComEA family DNA-binding protein [Eubacteriales bacterium]|nr:ComEA family DNA-binding protein [Eubacteriales bacterium]